jgi:hypothetical protein
MLNKNPSCDVFQFKEFLEKLSGDEANPTPGLYSSGGRPRPILGAP